jgi:hypothetical protein
MALYPEEKGKQNMPSGIYFQQTKSFGLYSFHSKHGHEAEVIIFLQKKRYLCKKKNQDTIGQNPLFHKKSSNTQNFLKCIQIMSSCRALLYHNNALSSMVK